jgi:hypothetical protein
MNSFFNYQPDSTEYNKLFSEAYENYANSKPSIVQNERIRPEGQDLFDWLMEDAESRELTNKMFEKAGIEW